MNDNFKNGYFPNEEEFDLRRYFVLIFRKRWMLAPIFSIVMVATLIHTFKQVPIYRATSTILIERPTSSLSLSATQEGRLAPVIQGEDYYNTQYRLLTNFKLLDKVRETLGLPFSTEALEKTVSVQPIRRTRLARISVDHSDPRMAAKISNTLVSLYIEQNIESMLFMSREILKAFPDDAKEIEQHTVYGQLKELSKEESIEAIPSIAHDDLLNSFKKKKLDTETQLAALRRRYKDKHPKIIDLEAELKFTNDKIIVQTDRILRNVKADLAGRLQANNIRIIEYANVPEKPIKPQKTKNILYGLFISAFFGVSTILFTEYLDDTIKNQNDIEKRLNLPYLGYFPYIKGGETSNYPCDFAKLDRDSEASTSIRNITTNIMFSAPKADLRTVLITSTIPQEGKSFLSSYIAFAFAKSGIKTLLLDADIRKPSMHKFFGAGPKPGLTNLLVEDIKQNDAIKKTKYDNLYLLPSGSKTPNPVEFLSSQKTAALLNKLKSEFERIIIDAPPGLLLPDALVLSKMADATLFVIKAGGVTKVGFGNLRDRLSIANAKIIGVVLNFFRAEKHSHYKQGYYHSYYKNYYSEEK